MRRTLVVRTQQGLGDAVYSYPIVKHLAKGDTGIVLKTNYPTVFKSIKSNLVLTFLDDSKYKPDLFPRYTNNRNNGNSQYKNMLDSVKLPFIDFKFDWELGFKQKFIDEQLDNFTELWAKSKKALCIIKEPCCAHMHKLAKDFSLYANLSEMQEWVFKNRDNYFFVSVGQDEVFKERLVNIGLDLNDKTSVQDLITLCSMAKVIVSQIGHLVPIAQGFNKPLKIFYPDKNRIIDSNLRNICKTNIEIKGYDKYLA